MRRVMLSMPNIKVIGIATNGIEAISEIKRKKPHGALLDFSMPGANGFEVFLEAKRWSPLTKFAIITGQSTAPLLKRIFDAGIDGLFIKSERPEDVCSGVVDMLSGIRSISPSVEAQIDTLRQKDELSNREYQVLQELARGLSNRQIAERLGVSPKTVDTHRTNLLRKMGVSSTASLLVSAMRKGMIDI